MPNGKITYKDIYDAVESLETKMDKRLDEVLAIVVENTKRITAFEYWKANITGKITVAIAVVSFGLTIIQGWVRERLFGKQ